MRKATPLSLILEFLFLFKIDFSKKKFLKVLLMNIITAVASFQLDGPISFIDIIASKEFKKFKRRGNILFIYFGCTRRKFAILFKSGKVITLITKTDGADQHIRRFSKKVAKRIYRANGGSGRVHDYRLRNCVVKI